MNDWAYYRALTLVSLALSYLEPGRDYNRTLLVKRVAEALRKARAEPPDKPTQRMWLEQSFLLDDLRSGRADFVRLGAPGEMSVKMDWRNGSRTRR